MFYSFFQENHVRQLEISIAELKDEAAVLNK